MSKTCDWFSVEDFDLKTERDKNIKKVVLKSSCGLPMAKLPWECSVQHGDYS